MTGLSQRSIWNGDESSSREHVIIENRHQPTTLHLKTYIGVAVSTRHDERYKITLYYNREYGEIYDLRDDSGELNNLWNDDVDLRAQTDRGFPARRDAERGAAHRRQPSLAQQV